MVQIELSALPGECATAFSVGLLGGVHCMGMCGGIVSAFSLRYRSGMVGPSVQRHLICNAGRIFSYIGAGALAGLAGSISLLLDRLLPVQAALYLTANIMLLLLGAQLAGWSHSLLRLEAAGAALWRSLPSHGMNSMRSESATRSAAMGMLWGLMPCGMVYSVLALALMSGNAGRGALVMLAFGLGTLPNLLAAGLMADWVRVLRSKAWMRTAAGAVIIALGVVGIARAPGIDQAVRAAMQLCLG